MSLTRHIQQRMSERCINEAMLQLVESFGVHSPNGERIILDTKSLDSLEKCMRGLIKTIEVSKRRGGFTLVEMEGEKITIFANNSYSKNKQRAC